MSAAEGRSTEDLAVEVGALHAQVCRMEALIASWYTADGLPIPEGLPDLAALSPSREPAKRGQSRRGLSLVVSR